jgi:hypothetical protein
LSLFFTYWEDGRSLDAAVRQAFGVTLSGFEKEYQSRTTRRYGGLALFADLSIVMLVLTLLVLPFFFARRARDRRRLDALLAADEAADKAERESAIALLIGEASSPDEGQPKSPV